MIKSIKFGFSRVWTGHGLVLHYFLANLVFAGLIMLPWWFSLKKYAGHSLLDGRPGGIGNFSFLGEFMINNPSSWAIMLPIAGISIIAYLLFSHFLAGGALSCFTGTQGFQIRNFWGDAGYYFFRFVRLSLWSLPLLLVPLCLFLCWEWAMESWDPYEHVVYWSGWMIKGMVLGCFFVHIRVLDYGRIHAVLNDERNMRLCLVRGLRFVRKRPLPSLALPLLMTLCAAVVSMSYLAVTQGPAFPWLDDTILLLLLGQIHILLRLCFKLATFAGELHYYESFFPRPLAVDVAERLWMGGPAILDKTLARGLEGESVDTEPEVGALDETPGDRTEIVPEPLRDMEHDEDEPIVASDQNEAEEDALVLPEAAGETQIMPAPPGQTHTYDPASDVIDLEDIEDPRS